MHGEAGRCILWPSLSKTAIKQSSRELQGRLKGRERLYCLLVCEKRIWVVGGPWICVQGFSRRLVSNACMRKSSAWFKVEG